MTTVPPTPVVVLPSPKEDIMQRNIRIITSGMWKYQKYIGKGVFHNQIFGFHEN